MTHDIQQNDAQQKGIWQNAMLWKHYINYNSKTTQHSTRQSAIMVYVVAPNYLYSISCEPKKADYYSKL